LDAENSSSIPTLIHTSRNFLWISAERTSMVCYCSCQPICLSAHAQAARAGTITALV
jgi:hypothetical protein